MANEFTLSVELSIKCVHGTDPSNLWCGKLHPTMSWLVPVLIYILCPDPRACFTPYVPVPVPAETLPVLIDSLRY